MRGNTATCALVAAAVALVWGAVASAMPSPPPPQQAVALVDSGVVWYDAGAVVLVRADGKRQALSGAPGPQGYSPPQMGSSSTGVALFTGTGLEGGLPPGPVKSLAGGTAVGARGCSSWKPTTAPLADFVVAGDELVVAAAGACATGPPAAPEPVFARDLRGGRWTVLRWLASNQPPMLAASGDLIAIGTQQSLTKMQVTILARRNGSRRASLTVPDGYLSFAGHDQLVLSEPTRQGFPLGVTLSLGDGSYATTSSSASGSYRVELYSTRGRHLASLGVVSEPPIVSGTHMLTVNDDASHTETTVAVRTLPHGRPRRVIGYNEPGRTVITSDPGRALVTVAFSWPRLALIQTTSSALPDGQFSCQYGTYGPPTAPSLTTLNLTRSALFIPPPATPPQPTSQQVEAQCGAPIP